MRSDEYVGRRRIERCREHPYQPPSWGPSQGPSALDRLATSAGEAVAQLIRSLERVTSMPGPTVPTKHRHGPWQDHEQWHGHEHWRDHEHWHDHDWCCGCCYEPGCYPPRCGPDPCHCACCIGDVDLVVYARVGETRVVPIRIENRRKRDRQIELELSDFTTKGGNPTIVAGQIVTPMEFTLEACSEEEAVLVIRVGLRDVVVPAGGSDVGRRAEMTKAELVAEARAAGIVGANAMTKDELIEALSRTSPTDRGDDDRRELRDVDDCHVAVADLRVRGCDTRPVRIAVAVLPRDCGPYDVRCDCGCC